MIEVLARLGYRPRFCVWELTLACDMRCRHCGSRAGKKRDRELSTRELFDVADQLSELGCERATLSGGEPTLHPDWDEVARRLRRGGVRVNIISNGWSWTPEHTRRAIDAGLENVAFSLDGPLEAHDEVRGKPGSFARVEAAMADCVAQGAPVTVVTHINALNKRSLPGFHAWLSDRGVSSWQLQVGNPGGTMSESRGLVIPPEDLLWLVPQIAEMKQSGPRRPVIFPADNIGYYGKFERILRDRGATICFWIGCRAGCQVIGIESDGNVKGCLSLPSARNGVRDFVEGNLRDTTLRALWTREGAFAYNRNDQLQRLEGFCGKCRFRDICRGGCSWSAFTRSGSRFDNPMCFYRVAVEHQRWELIPDAEVDMGELDVGGLGSDEPGFPV
jgi:radical SAM protein with 4Fe4S-binding SPASM domain